MADMDVTDAPYAGAVPPEYRVVPDFGETADFVGDFHNGPVVASNWMGTPSLGDEVVASLGQREQTKRVARTALDGWAAGDEVWDEDGVKDEEEKEVLVDEDGEPIRALYFVRVARPEFDRTVDRLQQELDMRKTSVRLMQETRRLKRLEKAEARNRVVLARENLVASNQLVDAKQDELKPLKKMTRHTQSVRRVLNESKRQLHARTEEELDKLIRETEFSLQHETMSLREEKAKIDLLKKLEQERPKVKALEEGYQSFQRQEEETEGVRGDQQQLESELKVLVEEQSGYLRVFKELKRAEEEIRLELEDMDDEVKAAEAARDRVFEQLRGARDKRSRKQQEFRANRDFSREVRDLVSRGQLRAAQLLCDQQVGDWMGRLNRDPAYRRQYLAQWESQRPNPMAVLDGTADVDVAPKASTAASKSSGLHSNVKVAPGQSLADAVVQKVLREAERETGWGETVEDAESLPEHEEPPKPAVERVVPKAKGRRGAAVVQDAEKLGVPKKKAVQVGDFELPAAALDREEKRPQPKLSEEEKRKAREAEAQKRKAKKERQKASAERRRQRAIEEKRAKEAEEAKAKATAEARAREAELKRMQDRSQKLQEEKKEARPSSKGKKTRPQSVPSVASTQRGIKPKPPRRVVKTGAAGFIEKYPVHVSVAVVGVVIGLIVVLSLSTV